VSWRTVVTFTVWVLAAGGAYWIIREESGVADAPAQVIAPEHRIASPETAKLAEVAVVPGQPVKAGQLLARLDTSVIEREIAVVEARRRQAGSEERASLVEIDNSGYETERAFQSDLADAASRLDTARAGQQRQSAEIAPLRDEIARQKRFVQEGLAKRDRLDELELRLRTADETLRQAPARIEPLERRVREAEERLRAWRTRSSGNAPRVQPMRDQAAQQDEAIRVLRARIAAASLLAPADGLVVSLLARTGDVAAAGVPFLILQGSGPRQVVAYVNERDGARISAGAPALLRRRSLDREEFRTKIARIPETVTQLPTRFWVLPSMPQWGREVILEIPAGARLDNGEALDVRFLAGGSR